MKQKMTTETKFIRKYTNVIDKSVCKDIIDLYERLWEEETERIKQMSLCYRTDGTKRCGACDCQRLDIMQHEEFTPYVKSFMGDLQSLVSKYVDELNLHHSQWPKKHGYEHLRVKRYFADNVQQHDLHVDVTNKDSAKRFLSVICYLNEDFVGGDTIFPQFNYKSNAETGSMLLFPCSWSYLHNGARIESGNPKYILGTFLNYVDGQNLNRIGDVTLGTKGI